MITLIHGPAELLRAEALAKIRANIADDPALADLNTAQFDGRQVTLAELQNACDTLPFLAERRLVVVEGLLQYLAASKRARSQTAKQAGSKASTIAKKSQTKASKAKSKALLAYLEQVPPTTELVFLEKDVLRGGAVLRHLLELQRDGGARVIVCQKPRRYDLSRWIRARAQGHRVTLDAGAVADLVEFVGDDLRQLDQELTKLADYVAGQRTVTRADVQALIAQTRFDQRTIVQLGPKPAR